MNIHTAIKQMRERAGLTQDELARLIGRARPMVSQYESGARVPSEDVLRAIVEATGIPLVVTQKQLIITPTTGDETPLEVYIERLKKTNGR